MPSPLYSIQVDLPSGGIDRSYPIVIGHGVLGDGEGFAELLGDSPVVLVSNDTVAPLYMSRVRDALGRERKVTEVILPDGEDQKHLMSANQIWQKALEYHHERRSVFIALGGGVIGDLTGYSAACFLRGVDFIQLPTTLLAQVDSSVGGKTAINHPAGKNMIGAFYQPQAVVVSLEMLESLPDREFHAGLAEVIKYGAIMDEAFFVWLEENVENLLRRDYDALGYAVERCCASKAEVVEGDETELGLRALLNFGHTFGHAIEAGLGFGKWLHGEAVAVGMLLALRMSVLSGFVPQSDWDRLRALLVRVGLPTEAPNLGRDNYLSLMGFDKKVLDGKLRLILLKQLGHAYVSADFSSDILNEVLDEIGS